MKGIVYIHFPTRHFFLIGFNILITLLPVYSINKKLNGNR